MRENKPANPKQSSLIKLPKTSTKRTTAPSCTGNGNHLRNGSLLTTRTRRSTYYKTKIEGYSSGSFYVGTIEEQGKQGEAGKGEKREKEGREKRKEREEREGREDKEARRTRRGTRRPRRTRARRTRRTREQ